MGTFMHATEGEMICTSTNIKIPYFNAPIFLENKTPIGKVDEILGPVNQVYFTIKPQEGIVATSFKQGDKFFIGGDKLLPLEKYVVSLPLWPILQQFLHYVYGRNITPNALTTSKVPAQTKATTRRIKGAETCRSRRTRRRARRHARRKRRAPRFIQRRSRRRAGRPRRQG